MLAGLAWRNLWRQPRRTILNLSSIAFAAMVMVCLLSLQFGIYGTMKENVLRIVDGFAQVQPTGYKEDPSLKKTIADPDATMTDIESIDGVGVTAPRAMSFAILSDGEKSFGAAIVGVDPAREVKVSRLDKTVQQGRYLEPGDEDTIVLGSSLARNLGVAPGDTVTLLGGAKDGSIAADVLTVVGIFETGTQEVDRQLAEMPLSRFQATFAMGHAVNTIVLSGDTLSGVSGALARVRAMLGGERLDVRDWKDLQPGLDGAISLDLNTSLMWYASLVIVVVFIILNTLLMSVLERTREFGMLLAIGMQPTGLGIMVWLELLFLALLGVAIGVGLGSAITLTVAQYGIELPGTEDIFSQWGLPGTLYPRLSAVSMSAGPGVMTLGIVLAGIFPYRHVAKLEPVSAMRSL